MQQTFDFLYGEQTVPLTIRADRIDVLEAQAIQPISDLKAAFETAVDREVIGSKPLKALISPDDEVTIIISDLTRAWMHQERIAPLLLDYLHEDMKLPYAKIVFLVALGTHRAMTEAELRKLVTDRVYDCVRVVNHEAASAVYVGTTTLGTRVCVNPLVVGRKVILMGGTVHHLLAGYGGGRKSILPGVASIETIQQNHSMALDPVLPKSSERVGCGKLDDNPINDDMLEAARLVKPVFGINLVVNAEGRHVALPSGDFEQAWLESCKLVDHCNGVPIAERADVVVATCGGFPKDINLYQSSKTLINAYQAVKEGGIIVFLSECREGGGPAAFFDWSRYLPSGTLDQALRANFTIAGYIFYVCCEIAAHTRLCMLTEISDETLAAMKITGFREAAALQQTLDFEGKHVFVMPHGSSTVPILKKSEIGG